MGILVTSCTCTGKALSDLRVRQLVVLLRVNLAMELLLMETAFQGNPKPLLKKLSVAVMAQTC